MLIQLFVCVCVCTEVEGDSWKGLTIAYKYQELESACDGFTSKNLIGKGGFGTVFRGQLRKCDVAVKILNEVNNSVRANVYYYVWIIIL